MDKVRYSRLVGKLIYLSITCPNIYVVSRGVQKNRPTD